MTLYSYTYDKHTGGLLLNSTPTNFSKEPRPVYYRELDLLGFNKYCKYSNQDDAPYMWAEANCYYYRGRQVAKLKGGNLYTAPELIINFKEDGQTPELDGDTLIPVDIPAMVAMNSELLEIIEQTTVKKILGIYKKYKNRLDIFHVAFSGGKDSAALLDLVKKALPKGSFVVVFGDTGMEFPDTYDVIDKVEKQCKEEGITFRRAKSHLDPHESWELFGPPSRVLRWCCSVHKSTPQTLELRNLTGKENYTGLAYVGIRGQESAKRSEYEYESYGDKVKGQYSHYPILEWTSAEVWLYMYANNVLINSAYKKGSARVGCLCCPMGGGKASYFERVSYKDAIDKYVDAILSSSNNIVSSESYLTNGGWNARKNGRYIKNNAVDYSEVSKDGYLRITVDHPRTDWTEWMKTIGEFIISGNDCTVFFNKEPYGFLYHESKDGYVITIADKIAKTNPIFGKLFRQVFRKAAYCTHCKTCQAFCKQGCISFGEDVNIKNCIHCHDCHTMSAGCLAYDSLKIPQGENEKMKGINCFSNHAPESGWLSNFFEMRDNYFENCGLGAPRKTKFKRFLKDASLYIDDSFSPFAEIISNIGWESETAWGLILTNLVAENPQIEWYVKNFEIRHLYSRKTVEEMLAAFDQSAGNITSIIGAFKRLVETPLGTKLNFGYVSDDGELTRTPCVITDHRVILYVLYKFAEKCDGYWKFTLSRLLDHEVESDGVSPTEIFGLDRADMEPILLGLTSKYPDFINATFTGDLDKISLRDDKTSADVLALF